MGIDPATNEQLYDLHPRRAPTCSLRAAVNLVREANLVPGAVIGRKQLGLAKCACIKARKATQCDCEQCTQITLSRSRLHLARPGWHKAFASANGGKGCACPLHDYSPQAEAAAATEAVAVAAAREAAARRADADILARDAPSSEAAATAAAEAAAAILKASEATDAAASAVAQLHTAEQRVKRYARMTESEEALMAALLPCGKNEYPEHTVTGEKTFKCYTRACCENNCPKRGNLFERRTGSACGYELIFEGHVCPVDNSDAEFIWQRWEKVCLSPHACFTRARWLATHLSPPLHCIGGRCFAARMRTVRLMMARRRSRATRWSSCRIEVHVLSS